MVRKRSTRSGGASSCSWLPICGLLVALAAMSCGSRTLSGGDAAAGGSGGAAGQGPGGTTGGGDASSAGTSGSAGIGGASSAGTSGSAGTGGGGAGGALAACAPRPATISNPCVYAEAATPAYFDLSVQGSLTSSGTTPPVGLVTRCLHQSQYYFTVQDVAGQSTTVGYGVASGASSPSLANLIGQTVSLRVRFHQEFQIDTDSVGFALHDSAGGLLFAAYGGTFYNSQGFTMLLAPADLQGIDITAAQPLCSQSSDCGPPIMTSYALQFQGSSTITLLSSTSGTVDAGGASYLAYHVSTLDPGQGCTDSQGWQGWSLVRGDL